MLDRMMKRMIGNKKFKAQCNEKKESLHPLTDMEMNTVRYMAGYVAVNLLKKCRTTTKNSALQTKRHLFTKVLGKMKALQQPGEPDTVLEYTTYWSELIDRGGLYSISDDVYRLMEAVEVIVREEMNTGRYLQGSNLCTKIWEKVLDSDKVLNYWEKIVDNDIPARYERYSIELLHKIVQLWINIRGFSFAKTWTMQFEQKNKKGTRKSLKHDSEA